jgi:1-deoxy-D-xylulose-5-phosphate synthase
MRFVRPLDTDLVLEIAAEHEHLVTVEENAVRGGGGSAINETLISNGIGLPVLNIGLPDRFVDQGSREELLEECGLDQAGLLSSIRNWLDYRALA